MRPSLVRAFAVHPKYSAQRSLRGRFGARHSTIPVLVKHGESGRRRSSGTPGRRGAGEGEGNFSDDIADLNAEIGGFVGDLGDPDFDTTAPSGTLLKKFVANDVQVTVHKPESLESFCRLCNPNEWCVHVFVFDEMGSFFRCLYPTVDSLGTPIHVLQ